MKTLKNSLNRGEKTLGTWLTIPSCEIAEVLCNAGFSWVVVDMEHSSITAHQAKGLIATIELSGCTPLVRVSENNPDLIKHAMDSGAKGVIVPMVKTKGDVEKAVRAVKYPPVGERGVGLARAQKYGFGFEQYEKWNREESIVIVQIEHIDAIKNLEEILSVPDIDASFIGPYDLSGSLGFPGNFEIEEFKKAIGKYEQVSKMMNKAMGYHVVKPDLKKVNEIVDKGYTFVAIGLDTIFLGEKCREILGGIK